MTIIVYGVKDSRLESRCQLVPRAVPIFTPWAAGPPPAGNGGYIRYSRQVPMYLTHSLPSSSRESRLVPLSLVQPHKPHTCSRQKLDRTRYLSITFLNEVKNSQEAQPLFITPCYSRNVGTGRTPYHHRQRRNAIMPSIRIDNQELYYTWSPRANGPILLFVHGIGSSHSFYSPIIPSLVKKGHSCLAFDIPGTTTTRK